VKNSKIYLLICEIIIAQKTTKNAYKGRKKDN
jgi:hypothetical protein